MLRIRKITDARSQANRLAVQEVQAIIQQQFPGIDPDDVAKLPDQLDNPMRHQFLATVLVAETSQGHVRAASILLSDPGLDFAYLEIISNSKDDDFMEWITRDKGYARRLTEFGPVKFPDGFSTIGDFPNLTQGMEQAGWSESRIRKIMGENWMRVLEEVWGV